MAGRRTKVDMAAVKKSCLLYIAMEKCSDEASYQELLAETDALSLSQGKPKFLCRSLKEFREPFHQRAQCICLPRQGHRHCVWSDDDFDFYDAMVAWAKESDEWQPISVQPQLREMVFVQVSREGESEGIDRFVLATYFGFGAFASDHPFESLDQAGGDEVIAWLRLPK